MNGSSECQPAPNDSRIQMTEVDNIAAPEQSHAQDDDTSICPRTMLLSAKGFRNRSSSNFSRRPLDRARQEQRGGMWLHVDWQHDQRPRSTGHGDELSKHQYPSAAEPCKDRSLINGLGAHIQISTAVKPEIRTSNGPRSDSVKAADRLIFDRSTYIEGPHGVIQRRTAVNCRWCHSPAEFKAGAPSATNIRPSVSRGAVRR